MTTKINHWKLGFSFILLWCAADNGTADPLERRHIEFKVKPKKCVALHKGQTCYQRLKFSWTTPERRDFCLHAMSATTPLFCWHANDSTQFEYKFASAQGESFQIRYKNSVEPLAELDVVTAWVYKSKKPKNRTWRLF